MIRQDKYSPSVFSASTELESSSDLHTTSAVIICTGMVIFSINLSLDISFSVNSAISLLNAILLVVTYIMLARSNSHVPNLELTFFISFCSIIFYNLSHNIAFLNLPFSLVIPPLVLWLTKRYDYCLVSLFGQLINISLLFRTHFEESIKYMPMDKLIERLTQCLTLGSFVIMLLFGYVFSKESARQKERRGSICTEERENQTNSSIQYKNVLNTYMIEVQNVFQTLSGSLDLLLTHVEPGLGAKLVRIAKASKENLERVIYNMAELNTQKVDKSCPTPVFSESLFQNLWETISLMVDQKGLEGHLRVDENLPKAIEIDGSKVKQMISNLFDYLLQTSSKGSIDLTVEDADTQTITGSDYSQFKILRGSFIDLKDYNLPSFHDIGALSHEEIKDYPYLSSSRNKKKLKITLNSSMIKGFSENIETLLPQIEEELLSFPAKNQAIQSNFLISKRICENLGGRMKIYSDSRIGTAFVMYIPFEVLPEKSQSSFHKLCF